MVEVTQGTWTCAPCDISLEEDEINHHVDLAEYEFATLEPNEDYGQFEYDDGRILVAGVPDWYLFFYQHRGEEL